MDIWANKLRKDSRRNDLLDEFLQCHIFISKINDRIEIKGRIQSKMKRDIDGENNLARADFVEKEEGK